MEALVCACGLIEVLLENEQKFRWKSHVGHKAEMSWR